jgi:hypothetical protein
MTSSDKLIASALKAIARLCGHGSRRKAGEQSRAFSEDPFGGRIERA